jgi:hypothetical protein
VTAVEADELTTQGGATDFARLIAACEAFGPYCLIGGLAVNCFVEPVYTLDADIVATASSLARLAAHLGVQGFKTEEHPHSLNAMTPESQLRVQFTTDDRYQAFLGRSVEAEVLGVRVRIACLEDVTQGKLWACTDPRCRLSKRKKDELDFDPPRGGVSRIEVALPSRSAGADRPRMIDGTAAVKPPYRQDPR